MQNQFMIQRSPRTQRGAVLLVAVVLLLLAGVMTLLALNVGVFEQRSAANDLRAKLVNEVGEAGLAQGFEFLLRANKSWLTDTSRWEKCETDDTTFPCGAVEEFEPDGTTPRRATLYRLKATGNVITDIPTVLSKYMLPLPATIATVGNGEQAAYGVAPLLCRAERPNVGDPADTPIRCGDGTGPNATDMQISTFVSVAKLPGESARTTLVQTVGRYPLLGDLLGVPPVTAAGVLDAAGNMNIVANGGGEEMKPPVSIWTRKDIGKTGTFNTCSWNAWSHEGDTKGAAAPEGSTVTCDTCICPQNGSYSYTKPGNNQDEGIDILDCESCASQPHVGINMDVRQGEFPCDLFAYIFKVQSHTDENGDGFCEKQVTTVYQGVTMGADEAYLYKYAKKINGTPAVPLQTGQDFTGDLSGNSQGLIWCRIACGLEKQITVGSPDHPVIVVIDGSLALQARVFGLVFLRSTGSADLDPATGGNAELRINAGGTAVYGGIVIQGTAVKINGGLVVSDPTVLGNLNENDPGQYATLPGAWNDQQSY